MANRKSSSWSARRGLSLGGLLFAMCFGMVGVMAEILTGCFSWMWDYMVVELWAFARDEVVVPLVSELWDWMLSQMPVEWTEFFLLEQQRWQSVIDWIGVDFLRGLAWIVPVTEVIGIVVGAWGVIAVIRLIRWVLSVIPFLSTG